MPFFVGKYTLIFFFFCACLAAAQEDDSRSAKAGPTDFLQKEKLDDYIFAPNTYDIGRFAAALGVSHTVLPKPLVEEEIRQIPAFDLNFRLGFPLNISLVSRLSSNVITNVADVGGLWSLNLGPVSVGAGMTFGVWYGIAPLDGFDVTALGWINKPFVTAGIIFPEFILSSKLELHFVTGQQAKVGNVFIETAERTRVGGALSVAVEQPFWKDQWVALGFILNYTRSSYQSWLAFSTFNDQLFYPEFFFALIL